MTREIWYILKGETCKPNGRYYREMNGVLQDWENGQWVTSFFKDLNQLKSFALRDYPNHQLTRIVKEKK